MTTYISRDMAAPGAAHFTRTGQPAAQLSPATDCTTPSPWPGPQRPAPPPDGLVGRSRLALGMSAGILGQPLIIALAVVVSIVGPAGSGPPAFWLAELLLIVGCVAGSARARGRGDRSLARGLLIGLAVAAGLGLLVFAAMIMVAIYYFGQAG